MSVSFDQTPIIDVFNQSSNFESAVSRLRAGHSLVLHDLEAMINDVKGLSKKTAQMESGYTVDQNMSTNSTAIPGSSTLTCSTTTSTAPMHPNWTSFINRATPVTNTVSVTTIPTCSATTVQSTFSSVGQMHTAGPISGVITLTKTQLAARKCMPPELPVFDGSPNMWPSFISYYEQSTLACGFSNQENLVRLQKCLTGKAKLLVSCLLTLPNNVPFVVERLRMLFGRPAQIIKQQVIQIRQLPDPTIDDLDTLITFGASVHNLISTMEATGIQCYLDEPLILNELVQRLCPVLKMQWAYFARHFQESNLVIFDQWMDSLVFDACQVLDSTSEPNDKRYESSKVNFHNTYLSTKQETSFCPICRKFCTSVTACNKFTNFSRNKRWKAVKSLPLCRTCLKQHSRPCASDAACGTNGCKRRHHPLLHPKKKKSTRPKGPKTKSEPHMVQETTTDDTLFPIVPVKLSNGENVISTYAFLDNGSSVSLIDQETADQLKAMGPKKTLRLKWTNDVTREERGSRQVSLSIRGETENHSYEIKEIRTVKNLDLAKQSLNVPELAKRFTHLKNIPLTSYSDVQPKILIGINHNHVSVPLLVKEGCKNDPIASKTRLGWVVSGITNTKEQSKGNINIHDHIRPTPDDCHQLIRKTYEIDETEQTNEYEKIPSKPSMHHKSHSMVASPQAELPMKVFAAKPSQSTAPLERDRQLKHQLVTQFNDSGGVCHGYHCFVRDSFRNSTPMLNQLTKQRNISHADNNFVLVI